MVQRICDIADEEGMEIFVLANGMATPFYQRFGFVVKEKVVLTGVEEYVEEGLVRPPRGS